MLSLLDVCPPTVEEVGGGLGTEGGNEVLGAEQIDAPSACFPNPRKTIKYRSMGGRFEYA